ncbi:MAG: PHP domain-containing protein [Clostridia bacterium]|nr:PHP domain-containing protein [Clostridia bacterium]
MIMDIHSHTYFSMCGRDDPDFTIQAAIDGGIELFGICDHNYGIADRKREYYNFICRYKEKYKGKIKILSGIELATVDGLWLRDDEDIAFFDYCLIEHIDRPDSSVGNNFVNYAKRCGCPAAGIAHTDLFSFAEKLGEAPYDFFSRLAENNIFWEMNVNYDSTHGYREHDYVKRFVESEYQQEVIRKSGVRVSVGFDGHRVEDYKSERVIKMCKFLQQADIPMPFSE